MSDIVLFRINNGFVFDEKLNGFKKILNNGEFCVFHQNVSVDRIIKVLYERTGEKLNK